MIKWLPEPYVGTSQSMTSEDASPHDITGVRRRMRGGHVALSAAFTTLVALVATTLTGCDEPEAELVAYCGTSDRVIIEATECEDDDDDIGVIYIAHRDARTRRVGDSLTDAHVTASVSASDATGRARLGLPARGGFGGNGVALTVRAGG